MHKLQLMGKIILENIKVYAFHGHLPEERKIGGNYLVNLEIEADIESAGQSDRLEDTFDYRKAYEIVLDEMKRSSSLLEHIAMRIIDKILFASDRIQSVKIRLSKMNPPFGGSVKAVSIELNKKRD